VRRVASLLTIPLFAPLAPVHCFKQRFENFQLLDSGFLFVICHLSCASPAIGYLRSALRSDNDYGNWDRKKVGSRTAMFTSTGASIVRTRHSQFMKSDALAALCNH
jgi:hypothetical protein